jgi:hypothetical protein
MRYHDKPATLRLANQDEPFFADRVIGIGDRQRQRLSPMASD